MTGALVPVFVAGACSATHRTSEIRARADAFIAGPARLLAKAVQALDHRPRITDTSFSRESRLARQARAHPVVQAGLFDRRAERDIERRAGHARAADMAHAALNEAAGSAARGTDADDPRLELILFITS
jgi:hypothetical protein